MPELVDDHLGPPATQECAAARLAEVFASQTRDEWVAKLGDDEVCVAPVNDIADALRDRQVVHRRLVAEVGSEAVGLGPAVGVGERGAMRPAPTLGEHTAEVLAEAGLSAEEIGHLRATGVV